MLARLTQFQEQCENELRDLLATHGLTLGSRDIQPDPIPEVPQPYISASIEGTSLRVFIYSDEAQLHGPSTDRRFESGAFRSPGELKSAFLEGVRQALPASPIG